MGKAIEKMIIFIGERVLIFLIVYFMLVICFFILKFTALSQLAIYKAKNPTNIKSSCLYLLSTQYSKRGLIKNVAIDGEEYNNRGHTLTTYMLFQETEKQFPFYHKNDYSHGDNLFWNKIVQNQNTCYKVKYIKALDLIFIDFIYLYDFEIPKEFQSHHFKPIQIKKEN